MTSSEALMAMTCRELKIELKKRDLPTCGLKRDLLNRLHEAETPMLMNAATTANDSGTAEVCSEVEPIDRRFRPIWTSMRLAILCASVFLALWRAMIPVVRNYENALSPQDLTWLNYPDHYKVLDVPANASSGDIRRAHRQKAKSWHPDKAATMNISQDIPYEATRIFGLSRDVLLDPKDRRLYDRGMNPAKCESSCELCACHRGNGASVSSCNLSGLFSYLGKDIVVQGVKTGVFFSLKTVALGALYSYRLPQCWIWHRDLPLWDKKRCTTHPADPMWSKARSIPERCKLECDDNFDAAKNPWEWDRCQKRCELYQAITRT